MIDEHIHDIDNTKEKLKFMQWSEQNIRTSFKTPTLIKYLLIIRAKHSPVKRDLTVTQKGFYRNPLGFNYCIIYQQFNVRPTTIKMFKLH